MIDSLIATSTNVDRAPINPALIAFLEKAINAYAAKRAPGDNGHTSADFQAAYDWLDRAAMIFDPDSCPGCGWVDGVQPASPSCPAGPACAAHAAMRLAYPYGRPGYPAQ